MATYGSATQQMKNIGAAAVAQPEEIRERRTAAEDVLGSLQADIGKEGTYDIPSSLTPSPVAPTAPPSAGKLSKDGYNFANARAVKHYDKLIKKGYTADEAIEQIGGDKAMSEDSIFKTSKTGVSSAGAGGSKIGQQTISLDKDKAKAQIESGSMFRQVSRMTAESEQLLARTGPLYDEMMRSTQLPIIEGAAAAARENTEMLRSAMARGGSARRDAFEAIGKIRAQDNINMQKGQALAQAHLNMDMWARENAKNVINFATGWSQNQAGIRESYQAAMDNAAALMDSKALPLMFTTAQKAQEYREAQSAQSRNKVNSWITGVLGIAEGVMTAYRGGDASGVNAQFASIGGAVKRGATSAYNSVFGSDADNADQTQYSGDNAGDNGNA